MTKSMQFSAKFGKFMFYFGNIIIGIIFVSPLIWMISASLKPEAEIFANMDSLTTFLPVQASLNNYAEVFSRLNLPQVFKNTLLYIALSDPESGRCADGSSYGSDHAAAVYRDVSAWLGQHSGSPGSAFHREVLLDLHVPAVLL